MADMQTHACYLSHYAIRRIMSGCIASYRYINLGFLYNKEVGISQCEGLTFLIQMIQLDKAIALILYVIIVITKDTHHFHNGSHQFLHLPLFAENSDF